MVQFIEPELHVIGETRAIQSGMAGALASLGAPDWKTDAQTDTEMLAEFGGRLCYLSFNKDLNPNVTRVRSGNKPYLKNILSSGHGSVIEHGFVNFALLNVSPVLTHELVRHRTGTAFSQLSGRFVRIDDIRFYWPDALDEAHNPDMTPEQAHRIQARGGELLEAMEDFQRFVSEELSMDVPPNEGGMSFAQKKKVTSAMRRFGPYGIRTHIMFSANHRALRHIIDVRNSAHAEEEVVKMSSELGEQMKARYPAIYQDMERDTDGYWTFSHHKV